MPICRSCVREIPLDSKLCPYCGTAVVAVGAGPTVTSPPRAVRPIALDDSVKSSSASIDDARFTPGTMLSDRYRIVGLLGKGGMGEVYRADDLKLRQPVALKFLPEALSKDRRRLDRFHHEVRVAREVSHPNVCRVYDIGETDEHPFITMEYIDGEDLASLLRRMGRPSQDKALQIARQVCAGLAAAHDKGVLHRDLKPHNVMIDGRGTVRITDFGLAGFVEDFAGAEIRAGTPAYMSPEQIEGRGVSVKSDIYSLGMVFFELFTGRRAFEEATSAVLQHSRSSVSPTSLSTIVPDIDPAVERVILRCLERDPTSRPSSALAVAAALPGGDPLAAALAAGETPDPAMVAAAGGIGAMRPVVAVACLVAFLIGIAANAWMNDRAALFRLVPLPKPPEALADRAGEILKKLGHSSPAVDSAHAFFRDDDYERYGEEHDSSPDRWSKLKSGRPAAIRFWYRQSPQPLIPPTSEDRVTLTQPPLSVSGMATVVLDTQGRLMQLSVVPPQKEDSPTTPREHATNWSLLFSEAQLDIGAFSPVEPTWTPEVYCDERAAWEGSFPDDPSIPLHIEGGAYRGKVTFFQINDPWTRAWRMATAPTSTQERIERIGVIVIFVVVLVILVGSVLIARRNLQLRRGDRTGATRLALVLFALNLLEWGLSAKHVPDPGEFGRLIAEIGWAMFFAGWLWILYIAVEPYVRRRWPQVLISWTRLLAGRLRDPLVGRDILIGAVFAVALRDLHNLEFFLPAWLESARSTPLLIDFHMLLGARYVMAVLVSPIFVLPPFLFLFVLFVLRAALRKQWIAVFVFVVFFTLIEFLRIPTGSQGAGIYAFVLLQVLWLTIILVLLMRFGLFAMIAAFFFLPLLGRFPITLDFSTWYVGATLTAMLTAFTVAAYGFHTALAGSPLFKDELLEA